jgi:hypothetical protein
MANDGHDAGESELLVSLNWGHTWRGLERLQV